VEAEAHGKLGPVWNESLLIVDDAHDLSLEHLMFIKEITDQGRLQYDHPLGRCLVAAGRGNTIHLKETLDLPDPRLSPIPPPP
jgi:hypothetical protein